MISFSFDKHWEYKKIKIEKIGKINEKNKLSLRGRQDTWRQPEEYNFCNYIAYINYTPLHMTGPIITYNAWIS